MWWIIAFGIASASCSAGFVLFRVHQRSRASRSYREYKFVKVKYLSLAEPTRTQFATHTPPLVKLGFELIGDFRVKPAPTALHERAFLSLDGEALAVVAAAPDSCGITLISVLEDGTCVHTTSVKNPHAGQRAEPTDRLWLSYLQSGSIADLHRGHMNVVKGLRASTGSKVIRLRKGQFREVMVYDRRVVGHWRFRHGGLTQKPPAPDLRRLLGEPKGLCNAIAGQIDGQIDHPPPARCWIDL